MQSDRYLKAVLTVIAVCLVWVCLRDVAVVGQAHAKTYFDIQNVRIVGIDRASGESWDDLEVDDPILVSVIHY